MKYQDRIAEHPTYESVPGYWARHELAIHMPVKFERAIVMMLRGWLAYADEVKARYDSGIGDDGVLGPEWEDIGHAIHGLLNGDTGRLDCGALSTLIHSVLAAEGFKPR